MKFKNNKGITLIAMIALIIVLIIIAGTVMVTLVGENRGSK